MSPALQGGFFNHWTTREALLRFFFQGIYPIISMVLPGASLVKNLPANAVDVDLIPGSERSPGEGNGNPL